MLPRQIYKTLDTICALERDDTTGTFTAIVLAAGTGVKVVALVGKMVDVRTSRNGSTLLVSLLTLEGRSTRLSEAVAAREFGNL